MSRDDAASWQDHLPLDDVPEQSVDAGDAPGADLWGVDFADAVADPGANLFSAEIENVSATDWDIDAESIWGDVGTDAVDDGGAMGLDFPI
ncbi:hypothetical protein SAMN04487846_1013 [Microbacterium sp. cf046]|uniref:hypothetical protein n=1 Tax=Microbacterium sp. cf046 TaxID=1761803 RepID=UPI0008E357F6|nr:hypothetical protein [Microbacterium sp. cf046]SFR94734.1 hypothetical protein SAMN04487846_1013 [Microbacterium sp. cf046]